MTPLFRKFALTAHVTFSVGWLGAVVAYLALAIVGLIARDVSLARAVYRSLELIGWLVIVPLSFAALLTGVVQSLGTPWGLLRYYWVLVKFVLTAAAIAVLLAHMPAVSRLADIAAEPTLSGGDFRTLRMQLVIHAAGGLLVLLVVTVLSVYKPWGMTPYGRRKQNQRRTVAQADWVYPDSGVRPIRGSVTVAAPRWLCVVALHAIGLVLLFAVLHLTGMHPHGP
jgi:hypothetical protein